LAANWGHLLEAKMVKRFIRDESGATAIEYALIAAFMVVCIVAAWPFISTALISQFGTMAADLNAIH